MVRREHGVLLTRDWRSHRGLWETLRHFMLLLLLLSNRLDRGLHRKLRGGLRRGEGFPGDLSDNLGRRRFVRRTANPRLRVYEVLRVGTERRQVTRLQPVEARELVLQLSVVKHCGSIEVRKLVGVCVELPLVAASQLASRSGRRSRPLSLESCAVYKGATSPPRPSSEAWARQVKRRRTVMLREVRKRGRQSRVRLLPTMGQLRWLKRAESAVGEVVHLMVRFSSL